MSAKRATPDVVSFNIKQVAEMVGVVPATIRNWEKNGLITPMRTKSNYRVFGLQDIESLKKIKECSVDHRMGHTAIKIIMPTQEASPLFSIIEQERGNVFSKKLISSKWREKREENNYTLEQVSSFVGISASHLSKLENGHSNVSLQTLHKLAAFYGKSVLYFFDREVENHMLVKSGQGETIGIGFDGVLMELLVNMGDHSMFPVKYTVQPGCGNLTEHKHNGEEFITILQGEIQVTVDKRSYTIKKGDSFFFRGDARHSWVNPSKSRKSIFLWVHNPIRN